MSYTEQDAKRIIEYYDKSALDITISQYDFYFVVYETEQHIFISNQHYGYKVGKKIYPLMISGLRRKPKVDIPYISITALSVYLYYKNDGEYTSVPLADLKPLDYNHLKDKQLNDGFKNKLLKELI